MNDSIKQFAYLFIESLAGCLGSKIPPALRRIAAASSATVGSTDHRGPAVPARARIPALRPPSLWQRHHSKWRRQVTTEFISLFN